MANIETILLVEDDQVLRTTIADFLDELGGYAVIRAESGPEGLQKWLNDRDRIDLVVTDYHMPVMNGLEMIRQAWLAGCKAKVILVSGEFKPSGDDMAFLDGFLIKPYGVVDLIEMIERLEQTT